MAETAGVYMYIGHKSPPAVAAAGEGPAMCETLLVGYVSSQATLPFMSYVAYLSSFTLQ